MSEGELRARREALGLSVAELAHEFRVLPSTLYRWEEKGGPPRGLRSIGADAVLTQLENDQRSSERKRRKRDR
jgi:transcriptional regulator with XRE-family HTH domain